MRKLMDISVLHGRCTGRWHGHSLSSFDAASLSSARRPRRRDSQRGDGVRRKAGGDVATSPGFSAQSSAALARAQGLTAAPGPAPKRT